MSPNIDILGNIKSFIDKLISIGDGNKFIDYRPNNSRVENHIHIDLTKGSPSEAELKKITELLKPAIENYQFQIYSDSTEQNLKEIEQFSSEKGSDEARLFVTTCIPAEDKYLWLSALMLREASESGDRDRVRLIKDQMVMQSGQKGRNIANICNCGYLEEYIIPWYKHYVVDGKDDQSFRDNYYLIVEQLLFVVFISASSSIRSIKEEIKFKVQSVVNAHMDKLFIHALGEANIEKAENVLRAIKADCLEIKDIKKVTTGAMLKAEIQLQASEIPAIR